MSTALAVHAPSQDLATVAPDSQEAVARSLETLKLIRTFVQDAMVREIDFGVIPGTGTKPVLLLPGAQKAALYFNVRARITHERTELGSGHVEVMSHCDYVSRKTEQVVAEGDGSATTMESKYRWRKAEKVCPSCGAAAIIKQKDEKGGNFLCIEAKGGCWAKYDKNDRRITDQVVGRVENPDIYDVRNTVLKMAAKRAQVAAALNLGCLSELFTQDLEDTYDLGSLQITTPVAQVPAALSDADAGRAEVNATFPAKEQPRHQAPPRDDAKGRWNAVWQWLDGEALKANTAWHQELVDLEVPEARRLDLVKGIQVLHHLASEAIKERPEFGPKIAKATDPTKRDPNKTKDLVAFVYAEWTEWTLGVVADYLAEKLAKGRAEHNLPGADEGDPDVDYPLDMPPPGAGEAWEPPAPLPAK